MSQTIEESFQVDSAQPVQAPEPEVPLPPRTSETTLAHPDMFMPLEEDSYKPIAGFPAADLRPLPAVEKYTGGMVNAFLMKANPRYKWQGAPWHMHQLNVHIVYIIKGWAEFEFEGVGRVRLEAGTALYQPPRNRHRELDASSDFEVLQIEIPAQYPTTVFMLNPATGEYETVSLDALTQGGELADVQDLPGTE